MSYVAGGYVMVAVGSGDSATGGYSCAERRCIIRQ